MGVGIAAFADETVFHQWLHWHHFHDKSTSDAGLVSDGLFHAFGWFATVLGLVLVAGLRRRAALSGRAPWGGILAGAGAFQLYDRTIQHNLLTLHQIRYHVDLVPCDWAWNVIAAALPAAGVALLVRERAPDHTHRHLADGTGGGRRAGGLPVRRPWPRWRTASFTVGALAVVVALPFPAHMFSAHLAQHLVVGMAGPLLPVLGRPVTLALRAWRGRRAPARPGVARRDARAGRRGARHPRQDPVRGRLPRRGTGPVLRRRRRRNRARAGGLPAVVPASVP
ncbi:DUF2243 domain-containing protein [Amycolatopsis thermoflava]|uniref:DUF2243 domain-containing protein n=1 Tax=Amycolatopsis thermoflava TaxID=84480 RepID=UPI003F4A7B80